MSTIKEDCIMGMIQMMGEVIAAALNLKNTGQIQESDQMLSGVLSSIMPEHADLIEMVDEKTALSLLANAELVLTYVKLLMARPEIKFAQNMGDDGEVLSSQAVRMMIRSVHSSSELSPKGHLIWGRLSGFELKSLLDGSEFEPWTELDEAIKNALMSVP